MSVADITDRAAVLATMDEYDRMGEEQFLAHYRFGKSTKFQINHLDKRYASKAVLGVAHGKQFPARGPLSNTEFSGGYPTIERLQAMGFRLIDLTSGGEVPPLMPRTRRA